MSPVAWGDIFTLLFRGDRIMELKQDEYSGYSDFKIHVMLETSGTVSLHLLGPVAQRLEQRTHNPLVPGSNPGGPTIRFQ